MSPEILIASHLEAAHVQRIEAAFPSIRIHWEMDLVAVPRYAADHTGAPFRRTPEAEARWRALLARADILFDFDRTHADDLPELAPGLRWIQATSAGIGAIMTRYRYAERMPQCVFTTASGVHAIPLAEFCMMAMLAHSRNLSLMLRDQAARRWERFAATDLADRTLAIIGMGTIGRELARRAAHSGMNVLGIKRRIKGVAPSDLHLHALFGPADLAAVLPRLDYLVLAAPETSATRRLIGARELRLLPRGAFLINVGRGSLVDEAALVEALRTGHLSGAALDVFETEPLPADSPLWSMPGVIISPHSASTSDRENGRITGLFCENLDRFLHGTPLRNVYDPARGY